MAIIQPEYRIGNLINYNFAGPANIPVGASGVMDGYVGVGAWGWVRTLTFAFYASTTSGGGVYNLYGTASFDGEDIGPNRGLVYGLAAGPVALPYKINLVQQDDGLAYVTYSGTIQNAGLRSTLSWPYVKLSVGNDTGGILTIHTIGVWVRAGT